MSNACCAPLGRDAAPLTQQMVYFYVLDAFPRLGRAPSIDELETDLLLSREHIAAALDSLAAEGVLRLGPVPCMILDAYPYSAVATRHRVHFPDGRQLYCMCAVDTFYVPFLTVQDLTIRSHCFHCRREIEVAVKSHRVTSSQPADPVVWSSTAPYDCPKTNFFCSQGHLSKWHEIAPDEPGRLLTLAEALQRGKRAADRITESRSALNEVLWAEARKLVCHCRQVPKATIVAAIARGASTSEEIAKETTACTGQWCETTNPKGRCCCTDLEALIEAYSDRATGNDKSHPTPPET